MNPTAVSGSRSLFLLSCLLAACLGAPAHTAARALYYDIGFRPFTRDLPHVRQG